jgi:hypothetical protein
MCCITPFVAHRAARALLFKKPIQSPKTHSHHAPNHFGLQPSNGRITGFIGNKIAITDRILVLERYAKSHIIMKKLTLKVPVRWNVGILRGQYIVRGNACYGGVGIGGFEEFCR